MTDGASDTTILVVEDESAVRVMTTRMLQRDGFRVVQAASPGEAIRIVEHEQDIALILADVILPEMSGPELVAKLWARCPGARVLFMSGYTDDDVIQRGLAAPGMELLQKPFSAQQLVEKVRTILGDV
jgi:CheY-like chemotaxis protein